MELKTIRIKSLPLDGAIEIVLEYLRPSKSSISDSRLGKDIDDYERMGNDLIKDNIVELDGFFRKNNEGIQVFCTSDGRTVKIHELEEAIHSNSLPAKLYPEGLDINIIALRTNEKDATYVPFTMIRSEEKIIFEQVKNLSGRVMAIRNFYRRYNNAQREFVREENCKARRFNRYDGTKEVEFTSKPDLQLRYALCRENHPYEVQRTIETLLNDPFGSKHKNELKLSYIMRISPSFEDRKAIDKRRIKQFREKFYKLDEVKQQIEDIVISNEKARIRGFSMLLVGPPGVGKSSIMEAIADMYNLPYEGIPLSNMTTPFELDGLDSGYENADAGRLVKAFAKNGTSEMVIGFDEIDKMNCFSKEGNPMNALYQIMLGKFDDKFLGCSISTENTIFIATANSIDRIPEAVINRFNAIVYLNEYSAEDRMEIAKRYIIPKLEKKLNLKQGSMSFKDSSLRLIISDYCEDSGARDLEHAIERIIRRNIRLGKVRNASITDSDVRVILDPLITVSPGIYYNRHRDEYSETVAHELKKCLLESKVPSSTDISNSESSKTTKKIEYLLPCRSEKDIFKNHYSPDEFSDALHRDLFGMDKAIKEVSLLFYTAFLKGTVFNSNIALVGGYGIGKTTFAENIAAAVGYHFIKISLNGIDDIRELKGFSSSYHASEPGRIIKSLKKAGSTTTVFQLDEIDKIKPEVSMALIELLDREFVDNFLDIPVEFKDSIFIATANDWGNVPAVIRDRFIVVRLDGYSRNEKSEILSDYIIPKLEKGYAASSVSIDIEENARKYLLETYCGSFGVRDAEKAMQRIVSNKLLDRRNTKEGGKLRISKKDIRKYMGEEPIPRGNFPVNGDIPGISKALSVCESGNGNAFAIETVLVDGEESLEITGLPKESATDSVKIAVTCIKKMYPDLLKGKHIHVHFGEGSVPKDGPSAGVALFMSIYSAAINKPLMLDKPYDIAYTGELSLTGGVFAVGGLYEKIQAACDSGCTKVFIPLQNYDHLDKKKLSQYKCEIVPISHICEVVEVVFGR